MAPSERGFICVDRMIKDNEIYEDTLMMGLWVKLIMMANWKDSRKPLKKQGVILKRGQLCCSWHQLGKEMSMSVQALRTRLRYLHDHGMIRRSSNKQGTIITICNYDKYQFPIDDANKGNNRQLTNDQQTTNNIRIKKEGKKERSNILPKGKSRLDKPEDPCPDSDSQKAVEKRGPGPQAFVDLWHEVCPTMPRVRAISARRKKAISTRLREYPDLSYWRDVFARVAESDFCRGSNDRNWVADIDFISRPDSHIKVMEGKYDSEGRKAGMDWDAFWKMQEEKEKKNGPYGIQGVVR